MGLSQQANVQVAAQESLIDAKKELILPKYCEDVYRSKRRPTRTVKVWHMRITSLLL
jgi:hypothetical protein